jgi:hypothetical protein
MGDINIMKDIRIAILSLKNDSKLSIILGLLPARNGIAEIIIILDGRRIIIIPNVKAARNKNLRLR